MRYGALAELRRLYSSAPQRLTGVVVSGDWYPAHAGISPASDRLIEAGLVEVVELPAFLAPDLSTAIEVAVVVAGLAGYEQASDVIPERWQRINAPERRAN